MIGPYSLVDIIILASRMDEASVVARPNPTCSKLGVVTHRQWRFEPGKRGETTVSYRFTLPGTSEWTKWMDVEGTHFGFSVADALAADWDFVND